MTEKERSDADTEELRKKLEFRTKMDAMAERVITLAQDLAADSDVSHGLTVGVSDEDARDVVAVGVLLGAAMELAFKRKSPHVIASFQAGTMASLELCPSVAAVGTMKIKLPKELAEALGLKRANADDVAQTERDNGHE